MRNDLDREIAAGMSVPDPTVGLDGNDRPEVIRKACMVAVIDRLADMGDDNPPWLAPVIAAHTAMCTLIDQLIALGVVAQAEAIAELAEYLEPLKTTREQVTR